MGTSKARMMENEVKVEAAREIARRVGLIEHCEDHGYDVDPLNDEALEPAYKLANDLITKKDPLVACFGGDRRELTDVIQGIRSDIGESCPGCDARE